MPLTDAQRIRRELTLKSILVDVKIRNENGDLLTDFVDQRSDSLDFANVSRSTLHVLMVMAYEAGMKAK